MISIMTADDYTKKQGSSSNYGTDLISHAFPNLGIKGLNLIHHLRLYHSLQPQIH